MTENQMMRTKIVTLTTIKDQKIRSVRDMLSFLAMSKDMDSLRMMMAAVICLCIKRNFIVMDIGHWQRMNALSLMSRSKRMVK